jgi:hypothetical protein
VIVRQTIACVLMLAGIGTGVMGLRSGGTLDQQELYLSLGLTLAGGLVFDSDTFIRLVKAWRHPGGAP